MSIAYLYDDNKIFTNKLEYSKIRPRNSSLVAPASLEPNTWQLSGDQWFPFTPLPTFSVEWDDIIPDAGSPNAIIELDMDYNDNGINCVLLVVKAGSLETSKNSVIITANTTAPDGNFAVPLYYSNKNRDPYLVSAEISGGIVTAEVMFIEPTYLYATNESVNRNQPYEIFQLNKPLHVRVVPKK